MTTFAVYGPTGVLQTDSAMTKSKEYAVRFGSQRLGYGDVVLDAMDAEGLPSGVCAILGPNGSGKTTLGLILEKGRYAYGNRLEFSHEKAKVKMLTFTDIHSFTGIDVQRHDQRLEATENDLVPTVAEVIGESVSDPRRQSLSEAFNLHDVMHKRINFLSSGELRKLLIINALLSEPDMLILDNPYIGLDAASRSELDTAIKLISSSGTDVLFLICDPADIPVYASSVITIESRRISAPITDPLVIAAIRDTPSTDSAVITEASLPPRREEFPSFNTAFAIEEGHIRYGDRSVIEGLSWSVGGTERWALTGPNGSGKSLLLSMVTADNPQAYANRITLFDRRRGSGESIWDIKDKIGYVNPEMQLYFRSTLPVIDIVARASRRSLSRFGALTPPEISDAKAWLNLLDINELADRQYHTLSSSEQRLVLLAAALIRQPPLLILDEPLHGLDSRRKERVKRIINLMVNRNNSALIFVTHYQSEIPSCVTSTFTLSKI